MLAFIYYLADAFAIGRRFILYLAFKRRFAATPAAISHFIAGFGSDFGAYAAVADGRIGATSTHRRTVAFVMSLVFLTGDIKIRPAPHKLQCSAAFGRRHCRHNDFMHISAGTF